jgi:uncharacterized protein
MIRKIRDLLTYQSPEIPKPAGTETAPIFPGNHRNALITLLLIPVCLTGIYYLQGQETLSNFLRSFGLNAWNKAISIHPEFHFFRLLWWTLVLCFFYFVIPSIVQIFIFRKPMKEAGLRLNFKSKGNGLYFLFAAIMLPILVSFSGSFQSKYPFYFPADPENNMAYFFAWHFLYLIQFAALEFFFRGFMVHNLKAGFGTGSVFIMTIPYCMIHFGKPGAETLAAIPAGIILGLLSLKGNSVVPGIFLHYLVALAMDVFSLWQKGII